MARGYESGKAASSNRRMSVCRRARDSWRWTRPRGRSCGSARASAKVLLNVKDPDERIQAEHLTNVNDLALLQDRDNFYIVLNKSSQQGVQAYPFVSNGLKSMRVNGTLYTYNKSSGKLDWYRDDVTNQFMILESIDELPNLIFGTMINRFNKGQQTARREAVDQKTIKMV